MVEMKEKVLAKRQNACKKITKIRQQLDKLITNLDRYEFETLKHANGTYFADMCKKIYDAKETLGEIQPFLEVFE